MASSPENGDKKTLCPEAPAFWTVVYGQVRSRMDVTTELTWRQKPALTSWNDCHWAPFMQHVISYICLAFHYLLRVCIFLSWFILLLWETRQCFDFHEDHEILSGLETSRIWQSWMLAELLTPAPGSLVSPHLQESEKAQKCDAQSSQPTRSQWEILLYDYVYVKQIYVLQPLPIYFFFENRRSRINARRKGSWMIVNTMFITGRTGHGSRWKFPDGQSICFFFLF